MPQDTGPTHSSIISSGKKANKGTRASVKDNTSEWVGDLQHIILKTVMEEGLQDRFMLSDIWKKLGLDRRRVHDSINKMLRRGLIEKIARGIYRLTEKGMEILLNAPIRKLSRSVKDKHESRRASAVGLAIKAGGRPGFLGVYFDNVMWYGFDGRFHRLGRGFLMRAFPPSRKISYFEVTGVVEGLRVDGVFVIYMNDEDRARHGVDAVRFEWRPPRRLVKRVGVDTARDYNKVVLQVFRGILAILRKVPFWVAMEAREILYKEGRFLLPDLCFER